MVEMLRTMTVEATAPFMIIFMSGDVMKVMTGPNEAERQHVESERSFTFLMVLDIGP